MDDITNDLPVVAVYLDDIVLSGENAENHLHDLKTIITAVVFENGCVRNWLTLFLNKEFLKAPKVDTVLDMPRPDFSSPIPYWFISILRFFRKSNFHHAGKSDALYTWEVGRVPSFHISTNFRFAQQLSWIPTVLH